MVVEDIGGGLRIVAAHRLEEPGIGWLSWDIVDETGLRLKHFDFRGAAKKGDTLKLCFVTGIPGIADGDAVCLRYNRPESIAEYLEFIGTYHQYTPPTQSKMILMILGFGFTLALAVGVVFLLIRWTLL